jgi:3-hydroxyacyl-[acyl-carrier-protein] dehydratase
VTAAPALPMPADRIIPHRPPMRLVETLLSYESGSGEAEACFPPDSFLAGRDGKIDEAALIELIAQAYAAVKGYDDLSRGKPPGKGFLVGMRRLRIEGEARAGDRLRISIRTVGAFDNFAIVEGAVTRGGKTVASGTLKLWLAEPPGE